MAIPAPPQGRLAVTMGKELVYIDENEKVRVRCKLCEKGKVYGLLPQGNLPTPEETLKRWQTNLQECMTEFLNTHMTTRHRDEAADLKHRIDLAVISLYLRMLETVEEVTLKTHPVEQKERT